MPQVPKNKLEPLFTENDTIGQRVARIRKEKGYSQKQIAEKIGIIQELVSSYETGRLKLSAEMLLRFAVALDASIDDLMSLKTTKKNKNNARLTIMRRLIKIESLASNQRKFILRTIDSLIKSVEKKAS
jgi:transcriptional regulator with XRE-family HTH domain